MDIKNILDDIQVVSLIVARWNEKYDINSLEYSLVMDKLHTAAEKLRFTTVDSNVEPELIEKRDNEHIATERMEISESVDIIVEQLDSIVYEAVEVGIKQSYNEKHPVAEVAESNDDGKMSETDESENSPESDTIDSPESGVWKEPDSVGVEDIDPEYDGIPTLSTIEREIIMHELGELSPEIKEAKAAKRQHEKSLKSLYYDDSHEVKNTLPESDVESGKYTHDAVGESDAGLKPLPGSAELKKVLGEILNPDSRTVADIYKKPDRVVNPAKAGHESLRKAIGLNDKYLLVRDLFNGNTEFYENAINKLDSFDSLDDAMLYMHDNFSRSGSNDGVKLLVELLTDKLR